MGVKESLLMTFVTHSGKSRTLNIPEPQAGLAEQDANMAAAKIVSSGVFDEAAGAGRPVGLTRAVRQVVTSSTLF